MNKYKYLLKNIGLLTISNFGSKILSFILIPLYTSVLSTADYGTYDLYTTTVNLLLPIVTIDIASSVLRFSLESKNDKREVFSIGLGISIFGTLLFILAAFLNYVFGFIEIFNEHICFFIFYLILNVFYQLICQFARGLEHISDIAVSGVINSVVLLIFNLWFLLGLKLGIIGYFMASLISLLVPLIYLIVRIKIWKYISVFTRNKLLSHQMKKYSMPMILNTISWWITNVSDRYVVIWMCGVAINGVYSVSNKIPSILNIFQTIFTEAWNLSSVKDYDKDDREGFFSNIYNVYNFSLVFICSMIILFTKVFARILFAKDFFTAWKFVPFLTIAVVFGGMSGFIGGIFSALMDTKAYGMSTIFGAIVNILLNILLVAKIGAMGAAISTLVSYIIVWIIRLIIMRKSINIRLNLFRDILAYIMLLIQSLILLNSVSLIGYGLQILCVVFILVMFRYELLQWITKIKRIVANRF